MDDGHRAAFVHESREGITELNNSLLALESAPDDDGAMDSIFRIAHTLKGNAAAMGYERVSGLAHALEDLLEEVRAERVGVDAELMDLLFAGVDQLDAMVSEISEEGETTVDPSGVAAELRALADGGDDEVGGEGERGGESGEDDERTAAPAGPAGPAPTNADGEAATPVAPTPFPNADLDDASVFCAEVTLAPSQMPGIDALFVLRAAEEAFGTYVTEPARDALEDGLFDGSFELFVVAESAAEVRELLEAHSKVESAAAAPLDGPVASAVDGDGAEGNSGAESGSDAEGDSSAKGGSNADEESGENGDSGADDDSAATVGAPSDGAASGAANIASVRVDVAQVDELYGLVEQLVTSRIKLRREMEEAGVDSDNLDELNKIASNLQNTAMEMRLIPLSKVVDNFPRVVRDAARAAGKEVSFEVEGADVELDRTILTEIRDPLIHVLRNAVDHGIEPPEERRAAGKPPEGTVSLTATRQRDRVVIEVSDDGGGIDAGAVREKAVEKGVLTRAEADATDDDEAYELVFHPGFSTAEEVTDLSGRGVGMDVVADTVKQLDGTVSVESDPGEGTTVRMHLPVTVAIVRVMFVEVGGVEYGVPVKNIAEVTRAADIRVVNGDEVVEHGDDIYPVLRLRDALGEEGTADGDGMLLRIREDKRRVALHCDAVFDQEEVVVKPLEGVLSGIPGLSGTAVLGDGDIVAVLDVVTL